MCDNVLFLKALLLLDIYFAQKKIKGTIFFIRVWHEFKCTSLMIIRSGNYQRGFLIRFRCVGVDVINNRCTRGAATRQPPEEDWFHMRTPSSSLVISFPGFCCFVQEGAGAAPPAQTVRNRLHEVASRRGGVLQRALRSLPSAVEPHWHSLWSTRTGTPAHC